MSNFKILLDLNRLALLVTADSNGFKCSLQDYHHKPESH